VDPAAQVPAKLTPETTLEVTLTDKVEPQFTDPDSRAMPPLVTRTANT
jgi:hypothetical protein